MRLLTRRDFIRQSVMTGLAVSTMNYHHIATAAPDQDTILVVIMLSGGPDFRYLLVPPYQSTAGTYGHEFWISRARTYELSPTNGSALQNKWSEYLSVANESFRIHQNCGWLRDQFESGNAALISNVYASKNRDHAHSAIRLERGSIDAGANDKGLSGWGGRLARICDTNVCSVSGSVRQFCFGPHPDNPEDHDNSNVIDGNNTRQMGLYEYETDISENSWKWSTRGNMSRALTSYYAAKANEIGPDSPYYQVIQHEQSVRNFGRQVNQRLETVPIPQEIMDLYDSSSGNDLASHSFGRQIRNMYDILACEDLLQTNILSADYGGWDHHRYMMDSIEPKIEDIFGTGKGLHTLYNELQANLPGKAERLAVLVYGEFGRQLAGNGDYGTDHGKGNYGILIGNRVNGGVYGNMFPDSEIPRFAQRGADIDGLTSYEQVIARICEEIKTGSGDTVVPGWQSRDIEENVNLVNLFT